MFHLFLFDQEAYASLVLAEYDKFIELYSKTRELVKLREKRRLDYDYSRRKSHMGDLQGVHDASNLSKVRTNGRKPSFRGCQTERAQS